MVATSHTLQVAVDLGTVPSDTLVWSPRGIDIFIDLNIPISDGESVQTPTIGTEDSPSDCEGGLYVSSEPAANILDVDCSEQRGKHVEEPVLLDGIHRSSGSEPCEESVESEGTGVTGDANCEITATADVLSDKSETDDTSYETTAKVSSEIAITGDNDSASILSSKGITDGEGDITPIPVSASCVFGIEGLDVDDISAACQLLELGVEDVEEEDDDAYETWVASRLFKLSAYCPGDETDDEDFERDDDERWNDFHQRSASGESLAPFEPYCTDLALYAKKLGQGTFDPWSAHAISVDISSDLRTLKLKRIKPNKDSSYRGFDKDDDWDILDRPPHKRQYKSLRQMYYHNTRGS
ncbi:hypothetical protein Mapa_006989 [Marchantia paleacea]|nr:hypothetical protein Mapa_006989 [Marchantia paleacea]